MNCSCILIKIILCYSARNKRYIHYHFITFHSIISHYFPRSYRQFCYGEMNAFQEEKEERVAKREIQRNEIIGVAKKLIRRNFTR